VKHIKHFIQCFKTPPPMPLLTLYNTISFPATFAFKHHAFILEIQYLIPFLELTPHESYQGLFTFGINSDGRSLLCTLDALEIFQEEDGEIETLNIFLQELLISPQLGG